MNEYMALAEDMTEWSQPVTATLQSGKMLDEQIPGVPVEFKIRFVKSSFKVCIYEIEATNLSTTQGIKFEANNSYLGPNATTIDYALNLEPGESQVIKVKYSAIAVNPCQPDTDDECRQCEWNFVIHDIKSK